MCVRYRACSVGLLTLRREIYLCVCVCMGCAVTELTDVVAPAPVSAACFKTEKNWVAFWHLLLLLLI